jgi:hypothetical protein
MRVFVVVTTGFDTPPALPPPPTIGLFPPPSDIESTALSAPLDSGPSKPSSL